MAPLFSLVIFSSSRELIISAWNRYLCALDEMTDYYAKHIKTAANSIDLVVNPEEVPHFPDEGLCIGSLCLPNVQIPALIDLFGSKGLCFLYDTDNNRKLVNNCLEQLTWRIALCLPPEQCEFVIYNGGNPGDSFNSLNKLNKSLFKSSDKVMFDAHNEAFTKYLSQVYQELAARISSVRDAGLANLFELNQHEGVNAKFKYTFLFISDFTLVTDEQKRLIIKIVSADCSISGVFPFISWDMRINLEKSYGTPLDYTKMLDSMTLLFPKSDRYYFKNSGNDELMNKFVLKLNSETINGNIQDYIVQTTCERIDNEKKQEKQVLKQNYASVVSTPYESVASEICVTVGVDIEDKHEVALHFNSGDYLHTFILGQSGSGKSVLLNNIITTAILKYSPKDLMLYLLDFKGVEFNIYRGIKHAKAILVDNSDPQLTLEVLRELKDENKRREKLFRENDVKNIDGYNRLFPNNHLPQILFVADECQVLFQIPENATRRIIQNEISNILSTIASQGRSQGIHMLLATQQLDGTDIPGAVLKNMTECFLLMSAPSDSNLLVPESSEITSKQPTGIACYYHKKHLQSHVQTYYANDDELQSAILKSKEKAASYISNGSSYFSGSDTISISQEHLEEYVNSDYPVALVGKSIKVCGGTTAITLRNDYYENLLIWGANKEHSLSVLFNAFVSLVYFNKRTATPSEFLVIDCYQEEDRFYKKLLRQWSKNGLCHIVERTKSGHTLSAIVEDIRNGCARPMMLVVIGTERFIELKRNLPLEKDDNNLLTPLNTDFQRPTNYQGALTYILEEGSIQRVHVLMQVDKPGNILFEGDYGINATDKFRHKIILKSENKYLQPMRFSQDIDVESLSDDDERIRAYYYPEDGCPQLFTPFILEKSLINLK